MTVLGIAAVISVIVAIGGMIDSFDVTVGDATAEAERVTPDRVVATLDGFRPAASSAVRALASDPTVTRAEPGLVVTGRVSAHGRYVDVAIDVVDPRSRMWTPTLRAGRMPDGGKGLLLSGRAAEELGVRPGDDVTVRHPVRTGSAELGDATTRAQVAGIHGNPFRQVAIAGPAWAPLMGLAGQANTVSVQPAPGSTSLDVRRALAGRPGVASVEEAAAPTRTLQDALDQFGGVLRIGWLFAIALALLMAFNATTINAEERRREHATMFAFGLGPRVVLGVQIAESLLVGLLATAMGVVIGRGVLAWIVTSLIPETFPDLGIDAALSSTTLLAAGAAGLLALALAPVLTARRLRRMDVPATLRVME
jgi:putative ABC transport system permease protein